MIFTSLLDLVNIIHLRQLNHYIHFKNVNSCIVLNTKFLNFCRISVGNNSWRIGNTTYWFCWRYSRGGLWPWVLWWWVEGHSVTRVYHSGWEVQREASLSGGWTLQDTEVVCNRCLPKQSIFGIEMLNYLLSWWHITPNDQRRLI